jgi:hypothetical protein
LAAFFAGGNVRLLTPHRLARNLLKADLAQLNTYIRSLKLAHVDAGPGRTGGSFISNFLKVCFWPVSALHGKKALWRLWVEAV